MAELRRIAVIGDTHDVVVGCDALIAAFGSHLSDVELILHTGDVMTGELLDELERFAPVIAVRSDADPNLPPRLTDGPRPVTFGTLRIELIRVFEGTPVARDDVDIVVHGSTHAPAIVTAGPTIYLNPGAPVFTESASMAFIEIADGRVRTIIERLPAALA